MREIKFRAWDEQQKVMHLDFQFIKSGDDGNDWIVFASDRQPIGGKPHPFENPFFAQQLKVMQFTGLRDKNGKEIYEGDIVKETVNAHYWEYQITTIPNARSSTLYAVETFNNCSSDEEDNVYTYQREDSRRGTRKEIEFLFGAVEVIGNIYENPELNKQPAFDDSLPYFQDD